MSLGWWFFHFVFLMFNPKPWGYDPIWWTYFSNGLVQPEHLSHHLFQRKKSQLSNSWTCCPMDRRSSFFGGHFFRRWGWGSASGNSGCWIFFNGGICFFGGGGEALVYRIFVWGNMQDGKCKLFNNFNRKLYVSCVWRGSRKGRKTPPPSCLFAYIPLIIPW